MLQTRYPRVAYYGCKCTIDVLLKDKKIGHKKDKKIGHGFALLETHEEKTRPDKTTPADTREQQGDVSAKVNVVTARETTCQTAMTRLGPVNVRVRVRVTLRVRVRHRVRVCNTDKTRPKIKI